MESPRETRALLKPDEVAQRLNISTSSVYHKAQRGELPGIKIGGSLRFREEAIEQHLRDLEEKNLGSAA